MYSGENEDRLYVVPLKTPEELYNSLTDEQIVKAHYFIHCVLENHRDEFKDLCFIDDNNNSGLLLTFDMLLSIYDETLNRIVSPIEHGPVLKNIFASGQA